MTQPLTAGIGALGQDDLPPFHVPMRFFTTAFVFATLAGLVWIDDGEGCFATRWSPGMLAATHLLTLGFFTMVMFGALFQVVPVLGGGALPRARLVATVTHLTLAGGALALARGLWIGSHGLLQAALWLLGVAFLAFGASAGACLLRRRSAALLPVRLAAIAFVATVTLGGTMAATMVWPRIGLVVRLWTDVHAAWGGLGWGLLLVIGVGQQVVPMFHVTPPYARASQRWPKWLVFAGLCALPIGGDFGPWAATAIAVGGIWHAAATLRILHARRRRRTDATVLAWQLGLAAITAALLLALAETWLPNDLCLLQHVAEPRLLLGLLFALGGIGTIVVGMLTKIVPFLAFLHLQKRAVPSIAATRHLPPMADLLGNRAAFLLVALQVLTAALAIGATLSSSFAAAAGAALAATGLTGVVVLLGTARRFHRAARAIAAALAAAG